jgi:hypothetical protein
MTKNTTYTELQLDIVRYVKDNGGVNVPVCPKDVHQNKNFYERVRKIEHGGLVAINRYDGFASEFTITQAGKDALTCCPTSKPEFPGIVGSFIEEESDEDFLKSLIRSSSISSSLKDRICLLLS